MLIFQFELLICNLCNFFKRRCIHTGAPAVINSFGYKPGAFYDMFAID